MNKRVTQSGLICPECGNTFTIWRRTASQREKYHKKYLYCAKCNKVTNHIELKNMDLYFAKLRFKNKEELNEEEQKIYQLIKKRGE